MSAYVVSKDTICAIVKAAQLYDMPAFAVPMTWYDKEQDVFDETWKLMLDPKDNPTSFGQFLLNRNIDSVNYRYGEHQAYPSFIYFDRDVTPAEMLGCVECYDYQACEVQSYYDLGLSDYMHELSKRIGTRKEFEERGETVPWGLR